MKRMGPHLAARPQFNFSPECRAPSGSGQRANARPSPGFRTNRRFRPKPSPRAVFAMPGYMSVYSCVSPAMAAFRLSDVAPIGLPVAGSPTDSVLDAERLMRWIVTHKVDYVLHGHMHRCNSITITRTLDSLKRKSVSKTPSILFKIISLGSSGVANSRVTNYR